MCEEQERMFKACMRTQYSKCEIEYKRMTQCFSKYVFA